MAQSFSKLNIRGTARPIRVAYLVTLEECPNELLDEIFDEAYSRWGGRRTLVVPSTETGIDPRYTQWLKLFDPDIIYSYVSLSDATVADLNEKLCSAYLISHRSRRFRREGDPPDYSPDLPFNGLTSLSIVSALHGLRINWIERLSDIRIIDQYFDRSESAFLRENFGFIRTSFPNTLRSEAAPEFYKCLTLISEASLADGHLRKSPDAEYFTDEVSILETMSKPNQIFGLSKLSDVLAPRLETHGYAGDIALTLVVGDSADDRLLFWNAHHSHNQSLHDIASLHLYETKTHDQKFMSALRELIRRRGPMHQGHHQLRLCSCSLPSEDLKQLGEYLSDGGWISVQVVPRSTHASCIPRFGDDERNYGFTYGGGFSPAPKTTADLDFNDNETRIPPATPWHMNESKPPPSIRDGHWMIDLSIERLTNHSRYSNVRHTWILPRRLRIQSAFKLTRTERPFEYFTNIIRTNRYGRLSVTGASDIDFGTMSIPQDIDAFRHALCNEGEWEPFTRDKEAKLGFNRYGYAEPSDKGRYLLGVLGHFENIPTAFEFLMNGYWRDILIHLGAVSPEKNDTLREELLTTLKKRLANSSSTLVISDEDQWSRLARIALQFGRKVQKDRRFVQYGFLKSKWEQLVRTDIEGRTDLSEQDRQYYLSDRRLDPSIQALCDSQILFQGREWQCRKCYNRNWVSIEHLSRSLKCEVCNDSRSAPVSGDWSFRLNAFVLEAYRDHGIEAVIWTLWILSQRARESFYFAPSLTLWDGYPEDGVDPVAEIDALAVVDGELYLCEAKASSRLSKDELNQLASVCLRVRPDVLLLASMDGADLESRASGLRESLRGVTKVEIIRFDHDDLDDRSLLPH